ncbi:MAG TPA: GGDEF domain-containing protein [Armatimonadota bacterium]|nr:GGDEF domain-containing protein [Armatimonadota bacterium]
MTHEPDSPNGNSHGRWQEIPEDSLSPAMEEMAVALADSVPEPGLRLAMVNQLFRLSPDAPYALAIQALTGRAPAAETASEVWKLTLELQHGWSGRLGEVVGLKSAAIEALERWESQSPLSKTLGKNDSTHSIRDYLERDVATGLYLRTRYDSSLVDETARATIQRPLSLVFVRLKGMAELAGSRGATAVDDVAARVGELLRHHFRPSDIPCQYGADYYATLLPATPVSSAQTLAKDLLTALEHSLRGLPITANAGIATAPDVGATPTELESAAVAALNQAHARGEWTMSTFVPGERVPHSRNFAWGPIAAIAAIVSAVGVFSAYRINRHETLFIPAPAATAAHIALAKSSSPAPVATFNVQPKTTVKAAAKPAAKPKPAPQPVAKHPVSPGLYWNGVYNGAILAYYHREGPGRLGKPYDNGPGGWVHNWKDGNHSAEVQDFKGGSHRKLNVFSTQYGAYEINDVHGFWDYYVTHGAIAHYGAPRDNEHRYRYGWRQDFEMSTLTWTRRHGIREYFIPAPLN